MSDLILEVKSREETGKNANRRLRAAGKVPAVVYGGGRNTKAIQVGRRKIEEILRQEGGEHAVFLLKLEGTDQSRHTMIRDLQVDSITGVPIHIDFLRVNMDEAVRVEVAVELVGVPLGVKNENGILDHISREVEIECLPGNIPAHISVDVSELHVGQHLEAKDLEMPEGITLLTEEDRVIASVGAQRAAEEEVTEDEDGLLSATAAEPQVVGEDD